MFLLLSLAFAADLAERIVYADGVRAEAHAVLVGVEGLLAEALRGGDQDEAACLGRKLPGLRALAGVGDTAAAAMKAALADRDVAATEQEARRLAIVRERVQALNVEARTCAGLETRDVVLAEAVADLPEPVGPEDEILVPPCGSCF